MVGRVVPWLSWEEWRRCRRLLFSDDADDNRAGVGLVECWRVRGRVPLAADATAALTEAHLLDAGRAPADAGVSDTLLRMQYSMALIRLVNGISDSQQSGKVAAAVDSLAQKAGLPRLLVEIRHAATHQQLPALPVLRLASRQALAWLRESYWELQESYLRKSRERVRAAIAAYHAERVEGLARARQAPTTPVLETLGSETEEEGDPDATPHAGPSAATPGSSKKERARRREAAMGTLRSLVAAHAAEAELAPALVGGGALRPPRGGGVEREAWRATVTALARVFPHLPLLLVCRASRLACAGVRGATCGADGEADGQEGGGACWELVEWGQVGLEMLAAGSDGAGGVSAAEVESRLEAVLVECMATAREPSSHASRAGEAAMDGASREEAEEALAQLVQAIAGHLTGRGSGARGTGPTLARLLAMAGQAARAASQPRPRASAEAERLAALEGALGGARAAVEQLRAAAGKRGAVGEAEGPGGSRRKFRRAESWLPCSVGCLPDPFSLSGRVPDLTGMAAGVGAQVAGDREGEALGGHAKLGVAGRAAVGDEERDRGTLQGGEGEIRGPVSGIEEGVGAWERDLDVWEMRGGQEGDGGAAESWRGAEGSRGVVIICAADGEAVDVHSPSGLAQLREAVGRAALTMAI